MGDESYKIVLYTESENENIPSEVKTLFEYINTGEYSKDDELISKIDQEITILKDKEEVQRFMTLEEDWRMRIKQENEKTWKEATKHNQLENARAFKENGVDLELIAKCTGLPLSEIEAM